ncbi:MAG TPA: hypothetical protein VFV99_01680 [Kofleriaceae bacterium]|nr:hypothetical protein [Kofleriaceae bacterium]
MRLLWVFVVGIAAFGCKDKQPAKSADPAPKGTTPTTPGSPTSAAVSQPRSAAPTLPADELFAKESTDSEWAPGAERAVRAVAPELEDLACKHDQCRATVVATNETELMAAVDKLQTPESLLGVPEAKSIKLTQPVQSGNGYTMTIYIRFDRE